MQKSRIVVLILIVFIMPLIALAVMFPVADVTAQDVDVGTPPLVIQLGQPLPGRAGQGIEPTLPFTQCYDPLPFEVGQIVYIESGVNIRSEPSGSSPIVWNTVYNNHDEDGEVIENPLQIRALIVEGPVCDTGSNWWRVELYGNDGWVSEGRPFAEGGYLMNAGPTEEGCITYYDLVPGQYADLQLDARVRVDPNLDARVRTVASAGTPVYVIGGGDCIDNIRWWRVQVDVVNVRYQGWMAEGMDGLIWLFPRNLPNTADGTLCNNPLGLPIGQRAYVHSIEEVPRYMRSAPGLTSPIMYELVDGTPFIVVGGPTCRDNLNWWQIEVLSSEPVTGWMAEGSSGVGWWISTVNPDEFAR